MPTNGLVLYYSFNSNTGSNVVDESGRGNTGKVNGTTTWITNGHSGTGGAMQFSGDGSSYINAGTGSSLVVTGAFTLSAWIMPAANWISGVIGKGADPGAQEYGFTWYNGQIIFSSTTDPQHLFSDFSAAPLNLWTHIVCTMDSGGQARTYINGSLYTNGVVGMPHPLSGARPLYVGRWRSGYDFTGKIDEVRVYRRAISASEAAILSGAVVQSNSSVNVVLTETTNGACPRVITRVWKATDGCGNSASATQTITVVDNTPPILVGVPPNTTNLCSYSLPPVANVTAIDDCGNLPVLHSAVTNGGCAGSVIRTWSAVDGCGNSVSASQVITLLAPPPPVFHDVPADITIAGGHDLPPAPIVTATGFCSEPPSTAGLVLYYSFDDSSESNVTDQSGNGNDGVVRGPLHSSSGKFGGAYVWDGIGTDYIMTARSGSLNVGGKLTIAAWFKVTDYTSPNGRPILEWADATLLPQPGVSGAHLWTGTIAYQWGSDGTGANLVTSNFVDHVISSANPSAGTWHHVAVSYDNSSGTARVYIDGILMKSVAAGSFTPDTTKDVVLGARFSEPHNPYKGMIDEVRIYNRALTSNEVNALTKSHVVPVKLIESTNGSCPTIVTRVWTATDTCGNSASATQKITIIDSVAPVLSGVPSNLVLTCDQEIPPVPVVTAMDDHGFIAIQFAEVVSGACPAVVTRTWTAFDECGNSTTATQQIVLASADRDGDGIPDQHETGTGIYVSPTNTGTDPSKFDTDGDGYSDGVEITRGSDPNDPLSRPRTVDLDFDGDLVSDIGIYYAQNGAWLTKQSKEGLKSWTLGGKQYIPVPADYDGDGRIDAAVVAPASGKWLIQTADGKTNSIKFNVNSAVPAIGDFDGDRKTDLCLYDTKKGVWYFYQTNGSARTTQFGTSGTVPVVADYDGDGKDDLAVYYPPQGQWHIYRSRDGYKQVQFGHSAVTPVPADYDGDGIDDLAVYEPATGTWFLSRSREGLTKVQLGFPGATPVVGDFDGDGRADPAIYFGTATAWYISSASGTARTFTFGLPGSVPLGGR